MNLTLRIWRQQSANARGSFVTYKLKDVTRDMSFLEMLDALNEDLLSREEPPVAFEHDCREGICGSCGFLINGVAHGGQRGTTVCQLSMRFFKDGDSLTLEPWRARAFPVIRDLIVNRSAFDRIIQAGGSSARPPEALSTPMRSWSQKKPRILRLTQLPASAVEPVSQPARMQPPCFLLPPKLPTSTPFRRVSPNATSGFSAWWSR
jgi:succinate dehydrogenase/fumarate reductase-like Fe-S protein